MKKTPLFLAALACAAPAFSEEAARPIVGSLSVAESGGTIRLDWTLPERFTAQSILVFRDREQILDVERLRPVAELLPTRTHFSDAPEPGTGFFYCVLAKTGDGKVFKTIIPLVNASVSPVRARAGGRAASFPAPDAVGPAAEGNIKDERLVRAARELSAREGAPEPATLAPHIFPGDSPSSRIGDDYYLYQILRDSFIPENYRKAADELSDFLGIKRSEEAAARAAFYLGESFYFLGDYRAAIARFLSVSDDFPELARKWLDSALDLYGM